MIKKTEAERKKRVVLSVGELVLHQLFVAKNYLVPVASRGGALKNEYQKELILAAESKRRRKNQKRLAGLV